MTVSIKIAERYWSNWQAVADRDRNGISNKTHNSWTLLRIAQNELHERWPVESTFIRSRLHNDDF